MQVPLLLYDGDCGLCQRSVQQVLRHDPRGRIHFAPLQGETASPILARHGRPAGPAADYDTVVLVVPSSSSSSGERLLERSDAVLEVCRRIGGLAGILGLVGALVPRVLRDLVYGWVARNRQSLGGTAERCLIPTPEERARFHP